MVVQFICYLHCCSCFFTSLYLSLGIGSMHRLAMMRMSPATSFRRREVLWPRAILQQRVDATHLRGALPLASWPRHQQLPLRWRDALPLHGGTILLQYFFNYGVPRCIWFFYARLIILKDLWNLPEGILPLSENENVGSSCRKSNINFTRISLHVHIGFWLQIFVKMTRDALGRSNLARKTLVDKRFLIWPSTFCLWSTVITS